MTTQQEVDQARRRLDAFTAGPVSTMYRDMADKCASSSLRQSFINASARAALAGVDEEKKTVNQLSLVSRQSVALVNRDASPHQMHFLGGDDDVDEKKHRAVSGISTVLDAEEIAQLKVYHDNSLAASTRKAYRSDYESFVDFLPGRFPRLPIEDLQSQCTLEHVLAYLNDLCKRRQEDSDDQSSSFDHQEAHPAHPLH